MLLNVDLNIEQILNLIIQLPEDDQKKLIGQLKNLDTSEPPLSTEKLKELALSAPTWTDKEYEEYIERRNHIKSSRLS